MGAAFSIPLRLATNNEDSPIANVFEVLYRGDLVNNSYTLSANWKVDYNAAHWILFLIRRSGVEPLPIAIIGRRNPLT